MSKTFEFNETSIPSQFSINLKANYNMTFNDVYTADFFRTILTTFADCCRLKQSKDNKRIGLILKDDKGNFVFGTILTFEKPEDAAEDDSGNWYLAFTFYEEDMEDLDVCTDNHSREFIQEANMKLYDIMHGHYRDVDTMYKMFIEAIKVLTTFLDVNVTEEEEVEVVLRSVFTATAAIEDGKKIFSIVPGEYIKQIIKDDASL